MMAGPGTGGVGLTDVLSVMKAAVQSLSSIAKSLSQAFPQSGATATSATTGSSGPLPAQPAGYLIVTINGAVFKLPYYNP